ncbi:phosphoribosyl-ATP diphosphatase [Candidatus Woesearchaeota archaeon]|nr:phosphoribosyl-ATP diphosphatase [Candidatus Woesearchaeota archaeon]
MTNQISLYRENIFQFMNEGEKTLFIPKNGGLNEYVRNILPDAGIKQEMVDQLNQGVKSVKQDGLEIVLARGEDIPQRVLDENAKGNLSYGLTGDDLFDEYITKSSFLDFKPELVVLNTYDWFDSAAKFYRPALCLMNRTGNIEDLPDKVSVAINAKYMTISERYLKTDPKLAGKEFNLTTYAGDTEFTVSNGTNDCCVEILYGGSTSEENNLDIARIFRFSDIVLVGRSGPNNPWDFEYKRIESRRDNPTNSYTSKLLQDQNEIVKKFGSESAEFVQELTRDNIMQRRLMNEALDVIYSTMLGLAYKGVTWPEVENELMKRWK